jgi:hypothetical protein
MSKKQSQFEPKQERDGASRPISHDTVQSVRLLQRPFDGFRHSALVQNEPKLETATMKIQNEPKYLISNRKSNLENRKLPIKANRQAQPVVPASEPGSRAT